MKELLDRLRSIDTAAVIGELKKSSDEGVLEEWLNSGVKFAASSGSLEKVYYSAVKKLLDCIVSVHERAPVLHEGGAYLGTWLESTGTINAELLSRYMPNVAQATFRLFAEYRREDGLLPYKITDKGPAYRQIQMVTPLARSVWNHYSLNGQDAEFLREMYQAMAGFDEWLEQYRNTRGSGCVEAFCTFDTGHDLSPRFWHIPDTPHRDDPRRFSPESPVLPLLAPDLTANVYCQRKYMARMADILGEDGSFWERKAAQSLDSLFQYCYDETDEFFYDLDRNDRFVRVQSDVLLRVLACEVGDRGLFDSALKRYLLNTAKFFAKYPLTSIAMDDPRFDPSSAYNSWAGTTNFLTLIRTPHAFEAHGRYVELTWIITPILNAMARMKNFAQTISPWTGTEGYTDTYSPAILCVLDFVERTCGILPAPEGELWFTGLVPYSMDHGEELASVTAYARIVDGVSYELVNTREGAMLYREGHVHIGFPYGTRAVTDRAGNLKALVGMMAQPAQGLVQWEGKTYTVAVKGNEQLFFTIGGFEAGPDIGVIAPTYDSGHWGR
ncbi:MGH1-like glycoside hydrolase domain-containing protein [Paenibacillus donghaensis]|uniref:Mannosylglycerate hydrolase MGH1-like glycoside hydrolase domain-containing protein n=1 Tax=Paenibacillus donghaensis TaxID=414771 RepID=A0A2Z2KYZ6_9BACL|nr:hypothetical protein [Paenibacillus donghaensis]ASA25998.1 hypothetical protein B9T62_37990 [Paenibacillus donghaensis]